MAKHKTGYAIGVVFCLGLSLTTLLSLAAPAPNIGAAQSPTRTPDPDVINALNQLIRDETCQLPCWWGWVLGEDNLESAKQKLETLTGTPVNMTSIGEDTYLTAGILTSASPAGSEDGQDVGLRLIAQEDNLLREIYLLVHSPTESSINWSSYRLPKILGRYGVPDAINIDFAIDAGTGYNVKLKYSELHFIIRYTVILPDFKRAVTADDTFFICNTFASNYMEILVLSDENATDDYFGGNSNFVYFTGVDNATFSEIFSEDNACIETLPREQWPED
ncbi:MAG: hypothetical protein DPW16_06730 [Chloroflexi bacterium]|nr:hypothetical protein [Chloroflexota bacterium]